MNKPLSYSLSEPGETANEHVIGFRFPGVVLVDGAPVHGVITLTHEKDGRCTIALEYYGSEVEITVYRPD